MAQGYYFKDGWDKPRSISDADTERREDSSPSWEFPHGQVIRGTEPQMTDWEMEMRERYPSEATRYGASPVFKASGQSAEGPNYF